MEDELQKARLISERMLKAHNERDFDLDWHKERADQLSERWQNIHSQIDSRLVQTTSFSVSLLATSIHPTDADCLMLRLRDLDGIGKSLQNYRDSYCSLDEWVRETEAEQLKAQENKPEDSKLLAALLNKQKVGCNFRSPILTKSVNMNAQSIYLFPQVLVAEIEQKQSQIDACQKHSEQYSAAIKVKRAVSL